MERRNLSTASPSGVSPLSRMTVSPPSSSCRTRAASAAGPGVGSSNSLLKSWRSRPTESASDGSARRTTSASGGSGGPARGVVARPRRDRAAALDDLAVVGLEHRDHVLACEISNLRAGRVQPVAEHTPAVDLLDVGPPACLVERLIG